MYSRLWKKFEICMQTPANQAIACALAGATMFAFTHVLFKLTGNRLNAVSIAFWNDLFALATIVLCSRYLGGIKATLDSGYKKFHWARSVLLTLGFVVMIAGMTRMPLANYYAIAFATPLVATVLSVIFLKEHPKPYHWIALTCGFVGILIILNPGTQGFDKNAIFPIICTILFAGAMLMNRKIPSSEPKLTFAFYPIVCTLLITACAIAFDFQVPSLHDFGLLAVAGIMGGIAVIFTGLAFSLAPTASVAPFEYTQMVWGVLFGYLIFHDPLSVNVALGAGLIIAAGILLVVLDSRKRS